MFNSKDVRSKATSPIDREFILSRISEEEIFRRYLDVRVEFGRLFKSPLRGNDKRPSCNFIQLNNGIYLKDFSGDFFGDCFDVVKRKFNLNYNKALIRIAQDFGLSQNTPIQFDTQINLEKPPVPRKKEFAIRKRKWNQEDAEFWTQYHLKRITLTKYNVYPIDVLWIDGEWRYEYRPGDPAYAYYFGNGNWKIYFPCREHNRFLTNGAHLQGWNELNTNTKEVIITKSLKDVMVLDILGFSAIAPPAEGALIDPNAIDILSFYNLFILFDNDEAGMKWARANSEEYDIPYVFLPGAEKDPSDYIKGHGFDNTFQTITNLLNSKKNG